jgi:hypothetical protein
MGSRDSAFESYEFGEGVSVEDFSGWETSGRSSSRPVFVRCKDDDPDDATTMLRFIVELDDAGHVLSATAIDKKGCVWGKPGTS